MSTEHPSAESLNRDSQPMTAVSRAIEELSENVSVRRVYGDPIEVRDKTIIPVARVGYGFGGGFGSGAGTDEDGGKGAGGGGGGKATPVGVLEITDSDTQFIRVWDLKRVLLAVGTGVVLGLVLSLLSHSSGAAKDANE